MWLAVLLLPAVFAQTTSGGCTSCTDTQYCAACPDRKFCVNRGDSFTCGNTTVQCDVATCNGAPQPTVAATVCWDGTRLRLFCDIGSCRWASTSCPSNPCDPSPCKSGDRCCVPTADKPCPTNEPPAAGTRYVCIAPTTCQCPASSAPNVQTTTCFDGSVGGAFCAQEAAGTCAWRTRTCPTDPCNPSPCTRTQTCFRNSATLGGTASGAAFTCVDADRCAGIVCPGLGKCFNGACVCDATAATRTRTLCPDGSATPVFDNDPRVCDYVDKQCPPPITPPTCTNGDVVINQATDPKCVPPTDPCVTPTPVTCERGLKCVPSSTDATKPVCICPGCPDNGITPTLCFNNQRSQICDYKICQLVPNPECNVPDPCSTIKCPDGTRCVNMGDGIVAGPICVPRDPCNPNPCTDPKTVCRAAIDVTANAAVAGTASAVAGARAFVCVPVPDPDPDTCDPNPCQNGGVCAKSSSGPVCRCQKGWTGTLCQNLDCEACANSDTKQCRTPNAVLSTDGATFKESCVCSELRIKGIACSTVESGKDGRASPDVKVPTRDSASDGKAAITGTADTSFELKGGRVDSSVATRFKGEPVVVEIDRLDADGKSRPGPLAKGEFARIKICSPAFNDKEPSLFLVDAANKLKENKLICADINVGTTVPAATFAAPDCWTFPVCHASTYAAGNPAPSVENPAANSAIAHGAVSIVALGLGLLVF